MSKGWQEINREPGRTGRASWRKIRLAVLARDNYTCQIRGPKCTGKADQVDHQHGTGVQDPQYLRAACGPCNAGYNPYKKDPQPRTTRTNW